MQMGRNGDVLMKYGWIDEYCLSKKGTEKDYKVEWEATRYMIRGKMFAMKGGDGKGRPIISLKLEPSHGEILRGEYPDIFPGYYMNKLHWNSVHLEGDVPDDVLRAMIDESHSLILSSFSRKAQAEIMA